MDYDASAGAQLVLVVDGIAYEPDDVLYGEDGSWGKAGEIVLFSSLADGTYDAGSLADKFVALMTARLPVVDHSRLDHIRREQCLRKTALDTSARLPAAGGTES